MGGAQEGAICVLTEVGGVLFGRVDVLGGRAEGPESAVDVGQVDRDAVLQAISDLLQETRRRRY
jgi:hypothetical protein